MYDVRITPVRERDTYLVYTCDNGLKHPDDTPETTIVRSDIVTVDQIIRAVGKNFTRLKRCCDQVRIVSKSLQELILFIQLFREYVYMIAMR